MRLAFWLVVFVLSLTPSGAQDAPRLRAAPPDEVLDVINELMENYPITPTDAEDDLLRRTLDAELTKLLQSPTTNLDNLIRAYRNAHNLYWPRSETAIWAQRIISEWIASLKPNFNEQSVHTFNDYFTIEANPIDFDADGIPEWVLQVTTINFEYEQLLFAAGEIGELIFIGSPLPWFGDGWGYYSTPSGFIEPQTFQDLTGDGKPEWVLALGGLGGVHEKFGSLYVLQWRGGALENIADIHYYSSAEVDSAPLFPYGVSIEYGQTEVIVRHQRTDNWHCESEWVTVHRWNLATLRLEPMQPTVTVKGVPGCMLRDAHVASWEGRYAEAVELYGAFLQEAATHPNYQPTTYRYDIVLHARLKRAMAYTMLEDNDAASAELEAASGGLDVPELTSRAPIPDLVRAAHAAYQDNPNALVLCASLYTGFENYYRYEPFPNTYWGTISYTIANPSSASAPVPNIMRAGCDAPAMIAAAEDTPDAQAAADILRVSDREHRLFRIGQSALYKTREVFVTSNPMMFDDVEEVGPAYLNPRRHLTLKERVDMTRADLERFGDDPRYGAVVRYHYAWALDEAGFDSDTLAAAYYAVIDHDPDSPWARLAALKVEFS